MIPVIVVGADYDYSSSSPLLPFFPLLSPLFGAQRRRRRRRRRGGKGTGRVVSPPPPPFSAEERMGGVGL